MVVDGYEWLSKWLSIDRPGNLLLDLPDFHLAFRRLPGTVYHDRRFSK